MFMFLIKRKTWRCSNWATRLPIRIKLPPITIFTVIPSPINSMANIAAKIGSKENISPVCVAEVNCCATV